MTPTPTVVPFTGHAVPKALLSDDALPRLCGVEGLLHQLALSLYDDKDIDPGHIQAGLFLLEKEVKMVRDFIEAFLHAR